MILSILTHIDCGGQAVLDTGNKFKLFAQTFSLSTTGIGNLILDVEILDGEITARFFCKTCGNEFDYATIATRLGSTCRICDKSFPVGELSFSSKIGILCITCTKKLRLAAVKNEPSDVKKIGSIYYDYVRSYELTRTFRTIPLAILLSKPINIL